MTKEMKRLQKEAKASATFRQHELGDWKQLGLHSMAAECRHCCMEVVVNTRPMPNDIDIGGEAVALTCPVDREQNRHPDFVCLPTSGTYGSGE